MFYLGISLERELFRICVLKKEKGSICLESLHTLRYGPDDVKLFYNLPPFHTKKPLFITTGLKSKEVLTRKLHLPLSSRRQVAKALPFQLESILPQANESSVICTQLKVLSKKMTSTTILATQKQALEDLLNRLESLDIHPDQVSCSQAAFLRFVGWQFPDDEKVICLDRQENALTCCVIENGEITLSQTLEEGDLSKQIEHLLFFLEEKRLLETPPSWFCTDNLKEHLPQGKILELEDPQFKDFIAPIGFALDGLHQDALSVDFCQKELMPSFLLKKRGKQLLQYAAGCLGAALLLALGGSLLIQKKEQQLISSLKDKLPHLSQNPSLVELEDALFQWEASLKGKKAPFALLPSAPKISDLLAHLSSHSALSSEDIEIQSIHYRLTKYPKITEPHAPYTAQVDLDFKAAAPRSARDFHEVLLKTDPLVNKKKEIKWQTQGQTYHTSFELNKGALP